MSGIQRSTTADLAPVLAAMGGNLMGDEWYRESAAEFVFYPGDTRGARPAPEKHKPGPCRMCGKKNVRRGRLEGVYLCDRCS
jgi:hypothetical protein